MSGVIEFKLNREKTIEALVYLASKRPRIDVFHIAKVLFYADGDHFRRFGRPILGDTYCALDDGPIPSFALNVAKRVRRYVDDETLDIAAKKLTVDDSDGYVRLIARAAFDDSKFSRTDLECLDKAIAEYADMPFPKLWKKVHAEREWKDHYRGSGTSTPIPYEAFLPPDMPKRDLIIEQLREQAAGVEI